jgi:hypothetical protein
MTRSPLTGGPAFPRAPIGEDCERPYGHQEGMSLRDYFAGQALAGISAGYWGNPGRSGLSPQDLAAEAYALADAMIKERNE